MKHTFIKLFRAIILVSASFIMLPSCSDYLDVVPDNIPTLDHAFADRFACEGFLFTCYSYLPRYGYVYGVPDFLSSDEFFTYDTPLNRMDRTTINIALGLQSVSDPAYNTWDGTRQARPLYQAIRDCNIFLENVDRPYDLEEYEKVRWVAEVNFLKAFYHFHMMQCYGPIILMDNNMPVSATPDEVAQYRTPFDECVDYVSNLLDIAAKDLPPTIVDRSNELGRATRPMALALKARLLAMAASPLFNGNSDYVNVVDNRGVKLFNTTFDQEKWVKAANACKEAIEAAEQADFGLLQEQDVQQQYALNDTLKQQFNLRMILYSKWNKEMLWASVRGNYKNDDNGIQDVSGCKISMKELGQVHVRQTLAPTFSLVETYYTRNGVPINEDKDFDYNSRYLTRMATRQDRWYIREGEETANLHFDREPRFYSSIGFDRAIWWGNGSYDFSDANYADDSKVRYVRALGGGGEEIAGKSSSDYYSVTAYWAKKLNNPLDETGPDAGSDWGANGSIPFPIMRIADLYLLYAETLNEANPSDAPPAEAYRYIDMVRARAGLNGVVESWRDYSSYPNKPLTKEGFRSIVHQERNIELAMEGQHIWDVRRWKEADEAWNVDVKTWNITGETVADFYKLITIDKRIFTRKDYLWPIREYNMSVNKNLVQNYGW